MELDHHLNLTASETLEPDSKTSKQSSSTALYDFSHQEYELDELNLSLSLSSDLNHLRLDYNSFDSGS